jgi:hypothetical protein
MILTSRRSKSAWAALLTATALLSGVIALPSLAAGSGAPRARVSTRDLSQLAMTSPQVGYGLLSTPRGDLCQASVARTTNRGATFGHPVRLRAQNCAVGAVTADGLGDAFVYAGGGLFATHDNGAAWSKVPGAGNVVQVAALGGSVWDVRTKCAFKFSFPEPNCPLEVSMSSDGGKTWYLDPAQPSGATGSPSRIFGTYLVRVNGDLAYVISHPATYSHTIPMWVTDNAGRSWHLRYLHCGSVGPLYVYASAAPSGALWVMCAGQPSAGSQEKSISVSYNHGNTWSPLKSCPPGLCNGYLNGLDAVSGQVAYASANRSAVLVTHNAGKNWKTVGLIGNVTGARGPDQVYFFNARQGFIAGSANPGSSPVAIWETDNGGRSWSVRYPAIG